MPPISASRSAPLISCTSPAARNASSQARRSCFDAVDGFLAGRFAPRISATVISTLLARRLGSLARCPHEAELNSRLSCAFRLASSPRRRATTASGLAAPAVQNLLQALWRDRQLRHGTRHSNGVIDSGSNRRANAGDAALTRPFDPERIERAGVVLAQDDVDLGSLAQRRHEIGRKRRRQGVAALVVGELLQQCTTQALGEATDDLRLDQG